MRRHANQDPRTAAVRQMKGLGLPKRLTFAELLERSEQILNKPIVFQSTELERGASAQLIQRKNDAVLQTHSALSERSRMACILHELAHVLMQDAECDEMPYLSLLSGRVAFRRTDFTSAREQTVELMADELALRTGLIGPDDTEGIFK